MIVSTYYRNCNVPKFKFHRNISVDCLVTLYVRREFIYAYDARQNRIINTTLGSIHTVNIYKIKFTRFRMGIMTFFFFFRRVWIMYANYVPQNSVWKITRWIIVRWTFDISKLLENYVDDTNNRFRKKNYTNI